ncbi:MAG: PEGA domain-containing protein [Bacteroidales bacterium]
MKKTFSAILLVFMAFVFSSCASLFMGNKEVVYFNSSQKDANVLINGKKVGTTPLTLKIRKKLSKQVVQFQKQNCTSKEEKIKKDFVLGSLFSQVLIPIDLLSGAAVDYQKNFYYADLKCNNDRQASYSKKDGYYYINENMDTIPCSPFLDIKRKDIITHIATKTNSEMMNENNNGNREYLTFELLNGRKETISAKKVKEFKTIEVYNKRFPIIPFKTGTQYLSKHYVLTSYQLDNKKTRRFHMEQLLQEGNYKLMKHIILEERGYNNYNEKGRVSQTTLRKTRVYYFLYENDTQLAIITNKNCLDYIGKYFPTKKQLINVLKKKRKMTEVERYVYGCKGSLPDRVYYFETVTSH